MKSNLFYGCTSAAEVQLRFDELSKVFNGQDDMLRTITTEYSTLMSVLTESKPVVQETHKENITLADIIKVLQEKVNPEGLHLEVMKNWLWVTGKTYQVKDILKELGFRYSSSKMAWFYRNEEHRSFNQTPLPMDQIRELYGSKEVALR